MKFHSIVFVILLNLAYFPFYTVHAQTIEELGNQLEDSDKEVRGNAVRALGKIRDERAVKWLISTLDDKEDDVREIAKESLINQGAFAIPLLVDVVENRPHPGIAEVLSEIAEDRDTVEHVVELFVKYLSQSRTQYYAIDSLGIMGRNKRYILSCHFASGIGMPTPGVFLFLTRDTKKLPTLQFRKTVRKKAVIPLINIALEEKHYKFIHYPKYGSSRAHGDLARGVKAMIALGVIGDKKATSPLVTILTDGSCFTTLRSYAAWALGEIGDRRAIKPLKACLKQPNCKMDASTLIYDIRGCDNFKKEIQEALSKIDKRQRVAKIGGKSRPNKQLDPKITEKERDSSNRNTWKIPLFVLVAIIIVIVIAKIP